MSNENQPTKPAERIERESLIERFYNQPEIGETQSNSESQQLVATNTSLYECNLCERKYISYQHLINHNNATHNYFNFLCWICRRNLKMSHSDMILHFKSHEDLVLHKNNYIKQIENILFSVYTKHFGDGWPLSVFDNENLQNITDIIRINAFLKTTLNVNISCKLWFVPKPSTEEKLAKFVWVTSPSIRIEWSSLNIKHKISNMGNTFMTSFLETTSIEDNGSGFVYYATSDISIKCIRMVKIGCFLPFENKYVKVLNKLTQFKKIFNPQCEVYCLRECINHYSLLTNTSIDTSSQIFQQRFVSFFDFEDWNQEKLDFGLRIIVFNEENMEELIPIFKTKTFHAQSTQINLLAIPNEGTNETAHFILVLNLQGMLQGITLMNKPQKKGLKYCNFCLRFHSQIYRIVTHHEKFCLHNPKSEEKKEKLNEMIEFHSEKNFLKSFDHGKTPPNWIGVVDFETVSVPTEHLKQDVCDLHKKLGQQTCMCSFSSYSEPLEALSYSLIWIDFNTNELLSEIFYIKKKSSDMSPSLHLVSILKQFALAFQIINQINYPIKMSREQKEVHEKITHCQRCGKKFSRKVDKKDIFKNISHQNLENIKSIAESNIVKTAHHLHHLKESNFLATICSKCNLGIQSRYEMIPILCHNFGRFDHVLLLKEICKEWMIPISFIPKSFNNIMSINANPFSIKDSLNFLSGSLDENVEIVKKSCLKSCQNCQLKEQCKQCKIRSEKLLKNIFSTIFASNISKVDGEINRDRFLNNLKKSAFPYSLLSSYQELKEITIFPDITKFDSILRQEKVNEKDYLISKKYFNTYCDNLFDFLKVYNLLDTHLLYAVWRVMSETLSNQFRFYIEKFYSLPGYSYAVAKSFTSHPNLPGFTCIEMFTEQNKEIYFKALENIRGGIVQVNSRFELDDHFKTFISNEIQEEKGEKKHPLKLSSSNNLGKNAQELLYLDATNLYGYCLSDLLPCGDYSQLSSQFLDSLNKLMSISDTKKKYSILNEIMPDTSSQGYAFQIKLIDVPKRLHEFPPFFASQKVKSTQISQIDHDIFRNINGTEYSGNRNERLLPLLTKGSTTFCHYKLLKQVIKQGVLLEILSGISFTQKYLFKEYISILAKLRAETDNPAHARSFKLLSNALFGKLLQSILRYNSSFIFFYVEDWEKFNFSKLNSLIGNRSYNKKKKVFKDLRILDKDFFAIETQMCKVLANNCPLIAFSILELAKTRNFSFFWNMKHLSPDTRLLYCDTDSFILKVKKKWYEEVQSIKEEFDFSKGSLKFSHLMKLSTVDKETSKGVLGRYKSEIEQDMILIGYIALQKKCYCLLMMKQFRCNICQKYSALCICAENYQGIQLYYIVDNASAKGKQVKQLSFVNYLETLLLNSWNCESRYKISQNNKKLYFQYLRYKSLSSFDDSNFTKKCGIHNTPFLKTNYIFQECDEENCKEAFSHLHHILNQFKKMLECKYFFENGEMKVWLPPSSPSRSPSSFPIPSFSTLSSTT